MLWFLSKEDPKKTHDKKPQKPKHIRFPGEKEVPWFSLIVFPDRVVFFCARFLFIPLPYEVMIVVNGGPVSFTLMDKAIQNGCPVVVCDLEKDWTREKDRFMLQSDQTFFFFVCVLFCF